MNQFALLQALIPQGFEDLGSRFHILRNVEVLAPIGRRALAKHLALSERVLRKDTDFLKDRGFIDYAGAGMSLTPKGKLLLEQLTEMSNYLLPMTDQERDLCQALGIDFCKVLPKDMDRKGLGHEVETLLKHLLPLREAVIAVTGGKTMAAMVPGFSPELSVNRQVTFVPARGGVGGSMTIQANTVSEQLANQTQGHHASLYVPEHVSRETYLPLMQEPTIAATVRLMKKADCVLYSVGNSKVMAERRGLSLSEQEELRAKHAVGEAFGCFFDQEGQIVYKLPRVGLHLSDLSNIPVSIAVVQGIDKLHALIAYRALAPIERTWFLIDERIATMVLNGETR